jgi:hypothetical protein
MARNLEPPSGDRDDWSVLYIARGDEEITTHRPFFTGDVFVDVPVQAPRGDLKNKTIMVIQHPCAMRPDGVSLADSILVVEVHKFPVLPPDKWDTNGKLMPLPDLLLGIESSRRHQAAFFDKTYHVHCMDLKNRIACLSPRGVNLLLQRWVYHSSRVVIPSSDFDAAVSPVYEQADIIEEWCAIALDAGRTLEEANQDVHEWLRVVEGGLSREIALQEPQRRAQIRRQARTAAGTWRAPASSAETTAELGLI